MRITRARGRKAALPSEQVVLFGVGAYSFAIAANAVDEIRSMEGLAPITVTSVSPRLARVKFALERAQKTYYVVDTAGYLRIPGANTSRVVLLRNSVGAFTADRIDRMAEIATLHALPRAFAGDERQWYRGLAVIGERVVPVINPDAMVSRADSILLSAARPQPIKAEVVSA